MAILLCATSRLSAQDIQDLVTEMAGSVTFQYPCNIFGHYTGCEDIEDATRTEVPPWIIGGGNNYRSYFLTDGKSGYVASSQLDMIHNNAINIHDNGNGPFQVSGPNGCGFPDLQPWRRTYYGMYTAQYLPTTPAGPVSLGFLLGENKSTDGCTTSITPVYPYGLSPGCYIPHADYYPNYSNFACAAWIPNNQSTNWGQQYFPNDMGPVVWPSSGYQLLSNGQKAALGTFPCSTIQVNGYLYFFYKDGSHYVIHVSDVGDPCPHLGDSDFVMEDGRAPGVKVARVPLADALNPSAYQVYYHDAGGDHWNPSLPAGFTKENLFNFLQTPGPQASVVVDAGMNHDYVRWSVAQSQTPGPQGQTYWLGVGLYIDGSDNSTLKIVLMYSYDLLNWQGARVIYSAANWSQDPFDYPIFLSSDGWSNTSIDPNDFYIVGTNPSNGVNNIVNRMHCYIPAPPPPPPPPPTCFDAYGRPVDCPAVTCLDPYGNAVVCPPDYLGCPQDGSGNYLCPQSQNRQTAGGVASSLDMGSGKAPYVYPNPGHGSFQLIYTLNDHAITQLNVLDVTGRTIQAGSTVLRAPGTYTESVNISGHAKGIYLLELRVNGVKKSFKVVYQ